MRDRSRLKNSSSRLYTEVSSRLRDQSRRLTSRAGTLSNAEDSTATVYSLAHAGATRQTPGEISLCLSQRIMRSRRPTHRNSIVDFPAPLFGDNAPVLLLSPTAHCLTLTNCLTLSTHPVPILFASRFSKFQTTQPSGTYHFFLH